MTIKQALAKANKSISAKIDNALTNEVYQNVRDEEQGAVVADVYMIRPEGDYKRRGLHGGLGDEQNIVIGGGVARNGTLVVKNITPPNPYLNGVDAGSGLSTTPSGVSIAGIIEEGIFNPHGYGYDYAKGEAPRPFTKKTIEYLREDQSHIKGLKEGLKRQKLKVL